MKLTGLERNMIYEAIMQTNLDPVEFNLEITGETAVISHDSGSAYAFDYVKPTMDADAPYYRILVHVIDGSTRTFTCTTPISSLIPSIKSWAKEAKLVAQTPDLWAELQRSRELIVNVQQTDSSNMPFTQDEQKQIAAQLQEIKKQIREQFELTSEQTAQVDERLDEIVEASKRMGRKDWFIYFLGTITALIITATVTAGIGEHIFTMFIHALGHLFAGGSEPSQIPPRIIA
jgi:hypothetical protein